MNHWIVIIGSIIFLMGFFWLNRVFVYFINQSKTPFGKIGSVLVKEWNRTFDKMTNWGLKDYHFEKGLSILDVGCGGGGTIKKLTAKVPEGKVYGIDLSKTAVKVARQINQDAIKMKQVDIQVGSVSNLSFQSEQFDLVTAIQTFMYWAEIKEGFEEIYRVIKPSGRLVLITEKYKIKYHRNEYEEVENVTRLLKSIGFGTIYVKETPQWISVEAIKE